MTLTDEIIALLRRAEIESATLTLGSEPKRELDDQISDVRRALDSIVTRRVTRERELERRTKWETDLVPAARRALDGVNRAVVDLERKQALFLDAEADMRVCENAVIAAKQSKPREDSYPSAKELARWRSAVEQAEARLEDATAKRRAMSEARDRAATALLVARQSLATAEFAERQLRPALPEQSARMQVTHLA